jgi:hypothetical protein
MEPKAGPLRDQEIADLMMLLKDANAAQRLARQQEQAAAALAATLEPGSASTGRALYFGQRPLENGGMACVGCHSDGAQGGDLGVALAGVHKRLGETPLISGIEQAKYPVMEGVYRDRPITRQEAVHLAAYLATRDGALVQPRDNIGLGGSIGAVVVMAGLVFYYRRLSPVRRRRSRMTPRRTHELD